MGQAKGEPVRYGQRETWQEYRHRLLAETSRFIEWGLRHPEQVTWIPAKPVGEGGFPQAVAEWFWGAVLGAGDGGRLQRWREKLTYAGLFLRGLK